MKANITRTLYKELIAIVSLFFVITLFSSCSVVESVSGHASNGLKFSRQERDVKIHPDIIKRVMHVKSIQQNPLDFFVFDLEGTLILHYKMKESERKHISGLQRGTYVYQVFNGDEMSESGKLNIK